LGPNPTDPHDVDYHLWTGGSDSDVNGCANCDICQTFHLHDRAERKRMSISLHGVGHGDFHASFSSSPWATGPCLVGRETTHRIMRGYILPLVKQCLGNIPAKDYLWRQWEGFAPIGAPTANPCVVVDLQYREGTSKFVIDDYQTNTLTNVSSSGGAVSGTVQGLTEGRLDDANTSFTNSGTDLFNSFTEGSAADTTRGAVFEWDGVGDRTLTFDLVGAGTNGTNWDFLSFRAAQASRDNYTIAALGDLTFTVTLKDGSANSSTIGIGAWGGGVEEPYQRTSCGTGAGWAAEFETIRVRLSDFANNGSGLDMTDLASITFTFGPGAGSSVGRLGFDDLELTND
jgi:hypothetical protein